MYKKIKRIATNTLLVLVSLLVSLLVVEITLRIFLSKPPVFRYPQESFVFDPVLGFHLQPNQSAFTHAQKFATNAVGIRDADYLATRSSNTLRVLALGDSQTFGTGLDLLETWPKQLELRLNKDCPMIVWEVINAGIPGTATWQHQRLFELLLPRYKPDAIVLAVYVNDIVPYESPDPATFTAREAQAIRTALVLRSSAVALTSMRAYKAIKRRLKVGYEGVLESRVISGVDSSAAEGWRQFESSIAAMQNIAKANGVSFSVLVLPRRDQVRLPQGEDFYNMKVLEIAQYNNVVAVDTLEALRSSYKRDQESLFIPWDSHNSSISNAVIAGAAYKNINFFGEHCEVPASDKPLVPSQTQ